MAWPSGIYAFSAVTVPILGSLAVLDVLAGWRCQDRGEGKSCTQLEQPIDPSALGVVGERADQDVDGRHVRTPQIDMAPRLQQPSSPSPIMKTAAISAVRRRPT